MEDFESMSVSELTEKIETAMAEPYYQTRAPEGMMVNHDKHERSIETVQRMFSARIEARKLEPPTEPDELAVLEKEYEQSPVLSEISDDKQTQLNNELDRELDLLTEINPDIDYFDNDGPATVEIIEAYKSLRLLNQGNLTEAGPLIMKTAEAAARLPGMDPIPSQQRVEALRTFISTISPGDLDEMKFLADTVEKIYELRNIDPEEIPAAEIDNLDEAGLTAEYEKILSDPYYLNARPKDKPLNQKYHDILVLRVQKIFQKRSPEK